MTAVTATIGAFVGPCDVVTYNANPGGRPGKGAARLCAPQMPALHGAGFG